MKGDFSRLTFKPAHQYKRVLMQQGRVQLDADWNEQSAIFWQRIEAEAKDLIGSSGAPEAASGFGISVHAGLSFNGLGGHLVVPNAHAFSFPGENPFTLELQLSSPALNQAGFLAGKWNPSNPHDSEFGLFLNPDRSLSLWVHERHGHHHDQAQQGEHETHHHHHHQSHHSHKKHVRYREIRTRAIIPVDQLCHIAVIKSPAKHNPVHSEIQIVVDGSIVTMARLQTLHNAIDSAFFMGAAHRESFWTGNLFKVKIWKHAKTVEEIQHRFHLDSDDHEHALYDNLIACWLFQDGDGLVASDSSKHHHEAHLKSCHKEDADASTGNFPVWLPQTFWIGAGRYYVGGNLCHNFTPLQLTEQPDSPGRQEPETSIDYLVYLDVWERYLSILEDPSLLESALGGPDTTSRTRQIQQVKTIPIEMAAQVLDLDRKKFKMAAQLTPLIPLIGNLLYRVEIHQGGYLLGSPLPQANYENEGHETFLKVTEWQPEYHSLTIQGWTLDALKWEAGQLVEFFKVGQANTIVAEPLLATLSAAANQAEKTLSFESLPVLPKSDATWYIRPIATFKWSNNNGLVVSAIEEADETQFTLKPAPWSRNLFAVKDWVELVNDDSILENCPGFMRQIISIDSQAGNEAFQVSLNESIPSDFCLKENSHPLIRRWECGKDQQFLNTVIVPAPYENWTPLENGIEVRFDGEGYCEPGDYWMIPSREGVQQIDWPSQASTTSDIDIPLSLEPEGIFHRRVPLAHLKRDENRFRVIDKRNHFSPVGNQLSTSGGTLTGPLVINASLKVHGHAHIDKLYGSLAPDLVGTEQIQKQSVTEDKLACDIGFVPDGFMILGESSEAPSGYQLIGSTVPIEQGDSLWKELSEHTPRTGICHSATIGNKLYVYWEKDGSLWIYHPGEQKWHEKTKFPGTPNQEVGFTALHGKLYIAGGLDDQGKICGRVDVYDTEFDVWNELPSLKYPRKKIALASYDGKIYALGGLSPKLWGVFPEPASRVVECYDLEKNIWFEAASLPKGLYGFACTTSNDGIHILGGKARKLFNLFCTHETHSHWLFNGSVNHWKNAPALPLVLFGASATVSEQVLFLAGGENDEYDSQRVFLYNLASRSWKSGPSLRHARHGFGLSVKNGLLYALGGIQRNKNTTEIKHIEECSFGSQLYIFRKTTGN